MASSDSSAISFAKLGKYNYADWVLNMRAYLQMKTVWRIVTGDETQPPATDADALQKFHNRTDQASGYIYLALEDSQKSHVANETTPKRMWEKLESIHLQKRSSTRFVAYNTLFNLRKKDG